MVSPHLWNQVPSRMMLAMGDYSALQPFDEGRLRVPGDLPPSGPEPPRDVLWALRNPGTSAPARSSENTTSDTSCSARTSPAGPVRYWRLFQPYPNLCQIASPNRDVVLLEPL